MNLQEYSGLFLAAKAPLSRFPEKGKLSHPKTDLLKNLKFGWIAIPAFPLVGLIHFYGLKVKQAIKNITGQRVPFASNLKQLAIKGCLFGTTLPVFVTLKRREVSSRALL